MIDDSFVGLLKSLTTVAYAMGYRPGMYQTENKETEEDDPDIIDVEYKEV